MPLFFLPHSRVPKVDFIAILVGKPPGSLIKRRGRHDLCYCRDGLAVNCAACGPRNIVSPVQEMGGRIVPTALDQKAFEFLFETHARIFFEYFLDHLRRDQIEAETQEIESRTEMNQGYFAREARGNSGRCMQRDRLPNHIGALWRHLMLYAEIASGIGAVHLKPVVAAIGRDQTQIVQDSPQNAASS